MFFVLYAFSKAFSQNNCEKKLPTSYCLSAWVTTAPARQVFVKFHNFDQHNKHFQWRPMSVYYLFMTDLHNWNIVCSVCFTCCGRRNSWASEHDRFYTSSIDVTELSIVNIAPYDISIIIDFTSVAEIRRNLIVLVKIIGVFWKIFMNLTSSQIVDGRREGCYAQRTFPNLFWMLSWRVNLL
jgi:hypothetical protein